MKVIPMRLPEGDALTQAFATVRGASGAAIEVGTARLREGERVPPEGTSRHRGIEISYVLSGVVDVVNEAGTRRIAQGDLVIVPADQWHYSLVREEATLVYALFEDAPCE